MVLASDADAEDTRYPLKHDLCASGDNIRDRNRRVDLSEARRRYGLEVSAAA